MCNIIELFRRSLDGLMNERGIDNVQLGKVLNVDPSVVRRWKSKNVDVRLKTVAKLSNYFKCSIESLCLGKIDDKVFEPCAFPKFGERLLRIMEELNVKPCRLFAESKIPPSSYYYWLRGGEPCLTNFVNLAKYLGVTLDYLMGRSED